MSLSSFEIEKNEKLYLRNQARKIMRLLRTNLSDQIEVHGQGADNIKGVEKVCWMLGKWILVRDVETSDSLQGNRYIIVRFQRSVGFHEAYKAAKVRAVEV